MNIKRTVARRIVWILTGIAVYAVLSFFGLARAQTIDGGESCAPAGRCDSGQAYANCIAGLNAYIASRPDVQHRDEHCWDTGGSWRGAAEYFNPPVWLGLGWGEWAYVGGCYDRPDINDRPPLVPGGITWRNGAIQCNAGCATAYYLGEANDWLGVATGQICTGEGPPGSCSAITFGGLPTEWSSWGCIVPPSECAFGQGRNPRTGECEGSCPSGMVLSGTGECLPEGPTCPAGQVRSPEGSCLPGDGQCAAGEVRGSDGTCKRDSDGDGDPDEGEDTGTFSGGEDCVTPPTCSGDNILCGQARIQWRIDCNTRRDVNISGGTCNAIPICAGEKCNAMEYAQLLQQWRTTCALEAMAQGGGGPGEPSGQPDWTKVTGDGTGGAGEEPGEGGYKRKLTIGTQLLDGTGFLGGSGQCQPLGMLDFGMFGMVDLDSQGWMCQFVSIARLVIIFFAGFYALGLLMGRF